MPASLESTFTTDKAKASGLLSRIASLLMPGRLVWLVLLVGGLLRLYRYDALSLWVDEGLTVGFGRLPWDTVLGLHGAYETHPPLYFVLAKAAEVFAPELTAGRLVSVSAGTLTLPVLFLLGRKLIGQWGALISMLVLALSPLHIWYSQEARPYALSVLVICASYLALAGFYESRDRRWAVLYGVTVALALYTNYSSIYALAPQVALLIYISFKHGKRTLWLWFAGVIGCVAFLPWLPQLFSTMQNVGGSREGYLGVSSDKVGSSVLSILGFGGQASYFWGSVPTAWDRWPAWQIAMLAGALVVAILGLIALAKHGLLGLLSALCLFAGTIIVGVLLSLISPGYAERTVLFALLGWALLAGAAPVALIAQNRRWQGVIGLVGLAVVTFFSLASLWAIYRGGDKQHWRDLARDSKEVARSGDILLLYPSVTGVLMDAYQPHTFDQAVVISDFGDLPSSAQPSAGADSLWLAYIETGGIDRLRQELEARNYKLVEHRYYWNPLWLDHYEASP